LLGGQTPDEFLKGYWQKKPLLVRGALPGFESPLTPEELAGLACDEDVESRLIRQRAEMDWELRLGPFEEHDFTSLPDAGWTLLVQKVDRLIPGVAGLLEAFRFVPNWRIDDVMVSFAAPGGGVGAHVDNYDVFLLQGSGRRRWEIHHEPLAEEELVPDSELRVLHSFVADEEWVLEPGDMLYLPPRVAHRGTAVDACMTYSIGFRAPSRAELVAGFLSEALLSTDELVRYDDPELARVDDPGEIAPAALQRLHELVREAVDDREGFDHWLGRFLSGPRQESESEQPADPSAVARRIRDGERLERSAISRFVHIRRDDGGTTLFVEGVAYDVPPEQVAAAVTLCGREPLDATSLDRFLDDASFLELLAELVARGALEVSAGEG